MNKIKQETLVSLFAPMDAMRGVASILNSYQQDCAEGSLYAHTGGLDHEPLVKLAGILNVEPSLIQDTTLFIEEGEFQLEDIADDSEVTITIDQRITALVDETIEYSIAKSLWDSLLDEHDGNLTDIVSDTDFLRERKRISIDQSVNEQLEIHSQDIYK